MKRFYKKASYGAEQERWPILLDGKPAKTPAGNLLTCPTEKVAQAISREWDEQQDEIVPKNMPLSQIRITQIDFLEGRREEVIQKIMETINTDLILYRAQNPKELHDKQSEIWDQWLDWMTGHFMVHFTTTTDLTVVEQEQSIHDAIEAYVRGMDPEKFALLYILANVCGSVVLPIAFLEGQADSQDLFQAVQVEEIYKQDFYNDIDPDTQNIHEQLQHEFMAAEMYLELLED